MLTDPEKVCLWGKTGSGRPTVRTTRLTHRRHPANGYSIISSVRAISIGGTWSPKRLRGFEIDDQLRPIGHQAAAGDEEAREVDRGQFVACCKGNDQIVMNIRRRTRRQDQAAIGG